MSSYVRPEVSTLTRSRIIGPLSHEEGARSEQLRNVQRDVESRTPDLLNRTTLVKGISDGLLWISMLMTRNKRAS